MTRETIAKIVKASGVSAGELILIHFWGENADKTVADQFAAAVAALGRLALEGEAYTDVTLQITNGEITGSSCEAVAAHFAGLPRENRIVCELGPGMNPNVTDLCGYTLLDEKMAGTFHIAVGANTMFGGENRATDHGDFVGRGEVEVLA